MPKINALLVTLVMSLFASSVYAADPLAGNARAGTCLYSGQSSIMDLADSEIQSLVEEYYAAAKAALVDPAVKDSKSAAYEWAGETKIACQTSIGYMQTGHLDAQSTKKCDCFYRRMVNAR
ncbi:hypothetical protein [Maritalea mobilis]|uniref:hypothetical protein n=1 Tax=Maritalea mobilis TaxID=483324 RepID=UPI00141527FC|nr:hypothetical protein [Maritalea mobilis]